MAKKNSCLRLAAMLLALGSVTSCAVYTDTAKPGTDKVAVCHKGKKTLWIAEAAVKAHLDHGDRPGPCR